MATYTEAELITHAARKSGRLGEDETLSAEGLDLYTKMARSRIGGLQGRGVNLWNYTRTAVPEELLDPLAQYLAVFILAPGQQAEATDPAILQAEFILRQLGAKPATGTTQQADYF